MQTLWLCLANKSVLTDTNIRSMKQYIANKFPTHSAASRANILANSVHRHINHYLPPVDDLLKEEIRVQLLQAAYSQDSFRIDLLDISKICVAVSSEKREILDPFEQWLKLQGEDITAEQVAYFIQKMQEELGLPTIGQNINQLDYPADPTAIEHVKWFKRMTIPEVLKSNAAVILITIMLCSHFNIHRSLSNRTVIEFMPQDLILHEVSTQAAIQRAYPQPMTIHLTQNELTERYNYHDVSLEAIRQWLKHKDSILAEEPYLSTIVETAYEYNIHPFLLLAIAGQEQALVPNSNSKASQIANNPFNVYHSWKKYNTDIADSSRIAAKTILTLIKGRPEGTHPLKWINRKYAEDPKWHSGVEAYFKQMLLQVTPSTLDQS